VGRSRNDVIVAMANWQYLLHATYCSVAQRSRMIPLSVSPISDEPGKQSLYPDGDLDQNLIIYSLAHCQHSLKISYKSVRLRKVGDRQTDIQIDKQRRLRNLLEGGKCFIFWGGLRPPAGALPLDTTGVLPPRPCHCCPDVDI